MAATIDLDVTTDPAQGLDPDEAARRLATVGPNRLAEPPVRPAWKRFADQFRNVLVLILLAAAGVAAALGDLKDAAIVTVVLVLNAVLGYVQEGRSAQAVAALREMLAAQARVRRGGVIVDVSADQVVPGDIVMLEPGDRVPADGRFVMAANLEVDESSFTGESMPVTKIVAPLVIEGSAAHREAIEHEGHGSMNTTVVRGRGELLVERTGMATDMGHLADLLESADPGQTPLQDQLDTLGKRLAIIAGVAVVFVFAVQLIDGVPMASAILDAVALAIAAVPEGLPAVVTVTLAVGVHHMAEKNAIVKRLASVETLGSTTVICSDKTGTLTLNQMTAEVVVRDTDTYTSTGSGLTTDGGIRDASGTDAAPALGLAPAIAALCSDAEVRDATLVGDPTEGALVVLAAKAGVSVEAARVANPRVGEVPFDSAEKFMATFHRADPAAAPGRALVADGEILVAVKGAADVLIDRCARIATPTGDTRPLDAEGRSAAAGSVDALAAQGMRVLALASRRLSENEVLRAPTSGDRADDAGASGASGASGAEVAEPDRWIGELTLEALVGIVDPARPEAGAAIALCQQAGISVKMITGDHAITAAAIAARLGIEGRAVTGADLDAMTDAELEDQIEQIGVCARVSPSHKVRIVQALQANREVVAMTGDGVNDAAALRHADIGVAMGITGTDVTKEASDMVLADDNFATIVTAVERGRAIYDNITTFVRFQLTTSMAAIVTIVAAGVLGLPTPLTAVQVLFVNVICDGPPAMTLGIDPPGPGTMLRAPRERGASILTRRRSIIVGINAFVMAVATLGVLAAMRPAGDAVATTMAFTVFVFAQLVSVFSVRSGDHSVFTAASLTNAKLWLAAGAVALVQVFAVVGPVNDLFHTTPLDAAQWGICLAVTALVLVVDELRKLVTRHLVPA